MTRMPRGYAPLILLTSTVTPPGRVAGLEGDTLVPLAVTAGLGRAGRAGRVDEAGRTGRVDKAGRKARWAGGLAGRQARKVGGRTQLLQAAGCWVLCTDRKHCLHPACPTCMLLHRHATPCHAMPPQLASRSDGTPAQPTCQLPCVATLFQRAHHVHGRALFVLHSSNEGGFALQAAQPQRHFQLGTAGICNDLVGPPCLALPQIPLVCSRAVRSCRVRSSGQLGSKYCGPINNTVIAHMYARPCSELHPVPSHACCACVHTALQDPPHLC
jgi:hypothetical protein